MYTMETIREENAMQKITSDWKRRMMRRRIRVFLILIPFLLCLPVYWNYYYHRKDYHAWSVLYMLYSSLRVYMLNIDIPMDTINEPTFAAWARVFIEAARWGGLLVTGTFFFRLLRDIKEGYMTRRKTRRKDAVAIHGSSHYKRILGSALGDRSIVSDSPEKFRARQHVLAFEDNRELFDYFNEHLQDLLPDGEQSASSVYMCLSSGAHSYHTHNGLIVNNKAEDCARMYWRDFFVRRFGDKCERRVAIIGRGDFANALLTQALMVNVFLPGQPGMVYHVYGSGAYESMHPGIRRFTTGVEAEQEQDAVVFHSEDWHKDIDRILQSDRIILADDAEDVNIAVLNGLRAFASGARIHVRARDERMMRVLFSDMDIDSHGSEGQICAFGTDKELYTEEIILKEALMRSAKMIHAHYLRDYGVACKGCARACDETACVSGCEHFEADWSSQTLFIQMANVRSADHMDVKLRQVLAQDCKVDADAVRAYGKVYGELRARDDLDELRPLMEMEHRRWMRHLFINGWEYAADRDNEKKLHPLLVPFEQLDRAQWEKDIGPFDMLVPILSAQFK